MNEVESSKIALFTLARYLRAPNAYRPRQAWRAAVSELADSHKATPLLERFADNSMSTSTLDDAERIQGSDATVLWLRILAVGRALRTPYPREALDALDRELRDAGRPARCVAADAPERAPLSGDLSLAGEDTCECDSGTGGRERHPRCASGSRRCALAATERRV